MGHQKLPLRGVVLRLTGSVALTLMLTLLGASSASAAQTSVCGTLQALTRNVPPDSPGSATIDGRTLRLTSALSTNATNRVDADVQVGQRVCLTGDLIDAPSPQGTVALFQNFVLASCSGAAPPSGCAQSLPSTATDTKPAGPGLPDALRIGGAVVLVAALAIARRRKPSTADEIGLAG